MDIRSPCSIVDILATNYFWSPPVQKLSVSHSPEVETSRPVPVGMRIVLQLGSVKEEVWGSKCSEADSQLMLLEPYLDPQLADPVWGMLRGGKFASHLPFC